MPRDSRDGKPEVRTTVRRQQFDSYSETKTPRGTAMRHGAFCCLEPQSPLRLLRFFDLSTLHFLTNIAIYGKRTPTPSLSPCDAFPMQKVWNIKKQPDDGQAQDLASKVGVSPIIARLLIQRGVDTPEAADDFFNPNLRSLHDPFLMRDMDRAVDRVKSALDNGERILVYGDYDVDGVTAVALVYQTLSRMTSAPDRLGFYIPDRFNEGYGISRQGVEHAHKGGYSLVIALDCGIKAVERMKEARALGIDFIICDHHVAGDVLPDVVACLDAKRPDCPYPDKNLSGCGVGFKLMEALYLRTGRGRSELIEMLDLLVVSIASDIVPMIGENRILAYHGLQRLNRHPNTGLRAVMARSGVIPGHATIADIVFKIGPRLNAAGRMKSGNDAVRLLLTKDRGEADKISRDIDGSNEERKDLDREITREAVKMLDANPERLDGNAIVLYEPQWSKGVIGIVASRLSEAYLRPTIILTRSKADPSFAAGSARSVEGFDLYSAIESCEDLLEDFGGHTYAAGLTLKIENVPEFSRRVIAYANEHAASPVQQPHIDADTITSLSDMTKGLMEQLERMEPFGTCNTRPVFITRNVYDYSTSKAFGAMRQHIKLDMIDQSGRGVRSGIAFGLGSLFDKVRSGQEFDICYTMERSDYRGRSATQLMIKDIHPQGDEY